MPGVPVHAVPTPHPAADSGHARPDGSGHPDGLGAAKIVSPVSGAGTTLPTLPLAVPLLSVLSLVPVTSPASYLPDTLQVARATGVADEALGNVRTVRAFAMEQREEE